VQRLGLLVRRHGEAEARAEASGRQAEEGTSGEEASEDEGRAEEGRQGQGCEEGQERADVERRFVRLRRLPRDVSDDEVGDGARDDAHRLTGGDSRHEQRAPLRGLLSSCRRQRDRHDGVMVTAHLRLEMT
jgi:hypothetical protein